MQRTLSLIVFTASIAVAAMGAHAQTATPEQKAVVKEKLKSMTPEERAEARKRARAKWDSMSPEEQEAARKTFAEKRPRLAERMANRQGGAASSPK